MKKNITVISAVLFLVGTWVFFDMGETRAGFPGFRQIGELGLILEVCVNT